MKKNDFILIAAVIIIAASVMGSQLLKPSGESSAVIVTLDGETYGTYDLNVDQTIEINGSNTLVIKEGRADMADADCPDRLCVYQRAISRDGESIICLPNKIIVTVKSTEEPLTDAVSN